jgi:hypothetical protein
MRNSTTPRYRALLELALQTVVLYREESACGTLQPGGLMPASMSTAARQRRADITRRSLVGNIAHPSSGTVRAQLRIGIGDARQFCKEGSKR